MNTKSEKAFYEQDVIYALGKEKRDLILWGEDLYDSSIVLYPKKLSGVMPDSYQRNSLTNAVLVYFNFDSVNFIRWTDAKWDEENHVVYLSAGNFDGIWKYLKNSVKIGMNINMKDEEVRVNPKDIVDLSYLCTDTREAVVKNDKISYKSREIPEETLKLMGKKQSMLDNPKNRFFFSSAGGYYHIKDCESVKGIKLEEFAASEDVPEGYTPCFKCRRKIFLRIACDPYVKQINQINVMLKKYEVRDSKLERYALDYGLKLRLGDEGDLYVTGAEDTWIIKGFDDGKFSLWHNNYVKTGPRERYITKGFHDQKLDGRSLSYIFDYIYEYSFDKHLEGEEEKESKEAKALDTTLQATDTRYDLVGDEDRLAEKTNSEKKSLFTRFASFIRGIFKKKGS